MFVSNDGVRLHVLDNEMVSSLPPVLVVPGMGERADEYTWLLKALGPRRVVVADVRGRGLSDAPLSGYTWEDHVGDLDAVVSSLALSPPVVVAFSRGSSYALGFALRSPVRGLVVGDYQARHAGLPPEFAERQLRMEIRGVPVSERMSAHVVESVVTESREVPLWDRLPELGCPVLVLRGDRRSTVVTDEIAQRWRSALPSVEIATIAGAGHDLWSRDREAYLAAVVPFVERISG